MRRFIITLMISTGLVTSSCQQNNVAPPDETGTRFAINETLNEVQNGLQVFLEYDSQSTSFVGTLENVTNSVITFARIEAHLDNGVELGPTPPTDLMPGAILDVTLDATGQVFSRWSADAESGQPGTGS